MVQQQLEEAARDSKTVVVQKGARFDIKNKQNSS